MRFVIFAIAMVSGLVASGPGRAELKVGWQTGVVNAVLTYAVATGKFREQGLEVELKPFPAGPAMLPALASREIDLAWMGEFPATTGFANGLPLRIVLVQSMLPTDVRLLAHPESGARELGGLRGKKIGVTIGSTSHHHALLALRSAGLTQEDVVLVNLAPANMAAAYAARQVDAVFTWEPGSGDIEAQGGIRLATTRSLGSVTGLFGVAHRDALAAKPDDVSRFVRGWSAALADYRRDRNAVLAHEAQRLNFSVEQLAALVERQGATFPSLDEQLDPALMGKPGATTPSQLLVHVGEIGAFLNAIGRLKDMPPSFGPLIDPSVVAAEAARR